MKFKNMSGGGGCIYTTSIFIKKGGSYLIATSLMKGGKA